MTDPRTGGCQCGGVPYEVAGPPKTVVACHCADCQRQSGSAFGMTWVVAEADFRLTKGTVKTFDLVSDAGRTKLCAFCPDCGTRLYHKPEWRKGSVALKPGTLDASDGIAPDVHLWTQGKQPWVVIPDGVEAHETQPG